MKQRLASAYRRGGPLLTTVTDVCIALRLHNRDEIFTVQLLLQTTR